MIEPGIGKPRDRRALDVAGRLCPREQRLAQPEDGEVHLGEKRGGVAVAVVMKLRASDRALHAKRGRARGRRLEQMVDRGMMRGARRGLTMKGRVLFHAPTMARYG